MTSILRTARRDRNTGFARDESGSMTAFGLFLLIVFIALGGLAVDFANAMRVRTHLQVAADSAAHAALVARQRMSEADAIEEGLAVASATIPTESSGQYIRATDFAFGTWDETTRTFTPVAGSAEAVMVDTVRIAERANSLPTFMLKIIGFDVWNVTRRSIYERYIPRCTVEGFMSEVLVDVTSNNVFQEGFCVHSNEVVELQNNNVFEPRAMVSMPDLTNLSIPSSGMDTNTGLEEALRMGFYDIAVSERIAAMHALVPDRTSALYPDHYLTTHVELRPNSNQRLEEGVWEEGRIHRIQCPNENRKIRIPRDTVLREGVLITNCQLEFGQGAALEDVIVLSTNTTPRAIDGPSSVRLGRDDGCAPGGDAQIITLGGVNVASGLSIYGSRIIAEGDVNFTAQADAVHGASILSNGEIRGTANGLAGTCGVDGMPISFTRPYFRIVG